jgi:3-oxoacyl-[acyl-carrier protein] reductase
VSQKRILITGASTGIGAAAARLLAAGNLIYVHYHSSAADAQVVARDVAREGGEAVLLQADLSTEQGCRDLVDAVAARSDRLDVLVNNAGGLIRRVPARELDMAMIRQTFALNAFSTMMVSRLSIPLLEKGSNPSIVNLSSIAVRTGAPSATAYGAAKGAVDAFTRGLARELAPAIRVNAVAPGFIRTPFHDKVSTPELLETSRQNTPLKRLGEAVQIAEAIRFLIQSDFITGETIDVNGGLFMR